MTAQSEASRQQQLTDSLAAQTSSLDLPASTHGAAQAKALAPIEDRMAQFEATIAAKGTAIELLQSKVEALCKLKQHADSLPGQISALDMPAITHRTSKDTAAPSAPASASGPSGLS